MLCNLRGALAARLLLLLALLLAALCPAAAKRKNLIIDTDIFSDCDDAGALLLAATSPNVTLLGLNVNVRSSYSALAASAILAHYGQGHVPIGARRPLNGDTFVDKFFWSLGEFTSKVAYHWRSDAALLPWDGAAEQSEDPVALYRRLLAAADDGSVTVASVGFLANLSALLNSTAADGHSPLAGPELVAAKVAELVVMGGQYPSGREFNFFGDDPSHTAHVVRAWPGRIVYSGAELGGTVFSGGPLMERGPASDPVGAAYRYYTYGKPRQSWDPLTVLYATGGLGDTFEYGAESGFNRVNATDGSNEWVADASVTTQRWLKLKVSNVTAAATLDRMYLDAAERWATPASPSVTSRRRALLPSGEKGEL
ncbi:hypothetical protein RB597_005227 [Gaeumannomyces tritici]